MLTGIVPGTCRPGPAPYKIARPARTPPFRACRATFCDEENHYFLWNLSSGPAGTHQWLSCDRTREEPVPVVQDCSDSCSCVRGEKTADHGWGGYCNWSPFCVRTRTERIWETSPIARQTSVVDTSAGGGSRVSLLRYDSTYV